MEPYGLGGWRSGVSQSQVTASVNHHIQRREEKKKILFVFLYWVHLFVYSIYVMLIILPSMPNMTQAKAEKHLNSASKSIPTLDYSLPYVSSFYYWLFFYVTSRKWIGGVIHQRANHFCGEALFKWCKFFKAESFCLLRSLVPFLLWLYKYE